MFKVICIQKFPFKRYADGTYADGQYPAPQIGDFCCVENVQEQSGNTYYQLEGYPDRVWYNAAAFAILPDATADEMQEQEKEAIVNLETT